MDLSCLAMAFNLCHPTAWIRVQVKSFRRYLCYREGPVRKIEWNKIVGEEKKGFKPRTSRYQGLHSTSELQFLFHLPQLISKCFIRFKRRKNGFNENIFAPKVAKIVAKKSDQQLRRCFDLVVLVVVVVVVVVVVIVECKFCLESNFSNPWRKNEGSGNWLKPWLRLSCFTNYKLLFLFVDILTELQKPEPSKRF